MNIQWFSKDLQAVATIYETNITLNTIASNHFNNSYAVLVGYDKDDDAVAIKSVSKEEVNMGLYNKEDLIDISIKPSYGRINGKAIINNITDFHPMNFSNKPHYKFNCKWIEEQKMLKVYLKREVS